MMLADAITGFVGSFIDFVNGVPCFFISRYFYPRQLLSQQFWHPDQKKEFVLEEYEQRSQYYLPLIKEVGVTAKEIGNKELLKFCLHVCHFFSGVSQTSAMEWK